MVRVPTRKVSTKPLELKPLGADGLDLITTPTVVASRGVVVARNVVLFDGIQRRAGFRKVAKLTDAGAAYGAKVFGSDTKYGYFTPPLIGAGGFAFWISCRAVRSGGVDWLLDSAQEAAYARYVFRVAIDTTGFLQFVVMWSDGTISSIDSAVVSDGSEQHMLVVFNPKAGTLTMYLNGAVSGTPVTGLASTKKPWQSNAVPWYVGASYNTPVGIFANSAFSGAIDDIGCIALAGVDIEDADATLELPRLSMLDELRRRNWQEWPCETSGMLLFHFGLDEPVTEEDYSPGVGVMYDSSERAQHGVYVGTPTNTTRVARRSQNGQFMGTVRRAAVGDLRDGRLNLCVAGGTVYYERLQEGV